MGKQATKESTCIFPVLGPACLGEDFEIDEAERHEAEGESRHEAGEQYQAHAYQEIDPEHGPAARLLVPSHRLCCNRKRERRRNLVKRSRGGEMGIDDALLFRCWNQQRAVMVTGLSTRHLHCKCLNFCQAGNKLYTLDMDDDELETRE